LANYSHVISLIFSALQKWNNGARQAISIIDRTGLAFKGIRAIGAVVARFVHTEEVTGSNPVSPTLMARSVIATERAFLCFFPCGPDVFSGLDFLSVLCERVEI
jgi:hypothetical protein